jgi:hypothetical protein
MSLILEALRKLDREKQVPERGFLVMAPAAWPSQDRSARRPLWWALAAAAVAVLAVAWLGRAPKNPSAVQPPAAAVLPPPALLQAPVAPPSVRPVAVIVPSAVPSAVPAAPSAVAPAPSAVPPSSAPAAMATPAAAAASEPALTLQAISERDGRPLAMINDRMLREGDQIDGARIVKIGDTFVEVEYQGRRMALRF